MLMMVGSFELHQMSSSVASCRGCSAIAKSAHGMIALFTCCFTSIDCMKLTRQILSYLCLPFGPVHVAGKQHKCAS